MRMRSKGQWVGAALAFTAVVAACEKGGTGSGTGTMATATVGNDRAECPHDWKTYFDSIQNRRLDQTLVTLVPGEFSIAGPISNVPEFHDCQRLLVKTGSGTLEYGPLAAVIAARRLDSVFTDSAKFADGLAVAEIMSEGAYGPLGIGLGFSCLTLKGTPGRWTATMQYVGAKEQDCRAPATVISTKTLTVIPDPAPGGPQDVPPVARWDWDARDSLQLIGVACGDRWCVVGPAGMRPGDVHGGPGEPAQWRVRGWYDEQVLAQYAVGTGQPIPSPVFGTIVADPALGSYTEAGWTPGDWKPAAHVAISGGPEPYLGKLGFAEAPAPPAGPKANLTLIELCRGNRTDCGVSGVPATCSGDWWMRSTAAGGARKYLCVTLRPFPSGFEIPAVVRWRWRADDETIWVRCPDGCCEGDAGS